MEYSLEELLPLVTKLSERYTGMEHSSITYERAEYLMNAIIYCIKENENPAGETSDSWLPSTMEKITAADAYQRGYDYVMKKAKLANELFSSISMNFCSYENRAYLDTVIYGMPEFFKKYDPLFAPQDHLLTLDYPTILQWNEHCGIDAIYLYLQYIELEQVFLLAFPYERILELLKRYHNNYEELFINVSSIVLRNIICSVMLGNEDVLGNIEDSDYKRIGVVIEGYTDEELYDRLGDMIVFLVKEGYDGNPALAEYLSGALKDIIFELRLLGRI